MRIQLIFQNHQDDILTIPLHYNHIIQAAIYNNISKELSDFIHDKGFLLNNRRFKMFTFSRLKGRFKLDKEKNMLNYYGPINLYVSSPIERFIKELPNEIIKKGYMALDKYKLKVLEIFFPPEFEPKTNITIKMLSPLTTYSTLLTPDGKKKTYYYSPYEKEFSKLINLNARKKHLLLTGKNLKTSISIEPLKVKESIILYKNTIIKGWIGLFTLKGDERIIKTVYDTGLGSKNSQGFGMFEVV